MNKQNFKYRINELLQKLPMEEFSRALKIIPRELKISHATFINYRGIKLNDERDIPHEKVMRLEQLFSIGRGELENFTTDTQPIASIPDDDNHL